MVCMSSRTGSGTVEIDVRGTVTGGGDNAAIMVSAGDGDTVKVNLESGAVLGAKDRKAVVETAGNAVLLVKSGATVRGNVNLGSGNTDKIEVNGTADRSVWKTSKSSRSAPLAAPR